MYLSRLLSKKQEVIKDFKKGFLPVITPVAIVCVLIAPANLSTALLIGATSLMLMFIGRVSGKHLLMTIGVVLKHDARPIVDACLKERLLINGTNGNVLRLLPPLNLTREEADSGLDIIERAFKTAPSSK